jgi:hypothetical protein
LQAKVELRATHTIKAILKWNISLESPLVSIFSFLLTFFPFFTHHTKSPLQSAPPRLRRIPPPQRHPAPCQDLLIPKPEPVFSPDG